MNVEALLRRLSRESIDESSPQIDIVADVLNTIAQRREREAHERPLLWLTGGAIAAMALIVFTTLPAWSEINSPWTSIIHAFPEVLL